MDLTTLAALRLQFAPVCHQGLRLALLLASRGSAQLPYGDDHGGDVELQSCRRPTTCAWLSTGVGWSAAAPHPNPAAVQSPAGSCVPGTSPLLSMLNDTISTGGRWPDQRCMGKAACPAAYPECRLHD